MSGRAYILCRFARESNLYRPWLQRLSLPVHVVDTTLIGWKVPDDAAILITHMHYRWDEYQVLRSVYALDRVPILILADGVMEYRNIYEHPDLADGCIFQPVVGHKLACLGRAQARIVESWGNVGKCEIVGLPRLDASFSQPVEPREEQGPFRLLIATATTPAFNAVQRRAVIQSLGQIKNIIEEMGQVHGRPIEVQWRLTDGYDFELGITPPDTQQQVPPLDEAITHADAVMTTPSTLFLESALRGRPTALLDFHLAPQFIASAWTISEPQQVRSIISDLAQPPAAKMLFQWTSLHDQLRFDGGATDRMVSLIEEMVWAGRESRSAGLRVHLPARMVDDPDAGFARVEPFFDLRRLFPANSTFHNQDLAAMQVELNLAVERLKDKEDAIRNLKAQLAYLRKRMSEGKTQYKTLKGRLLKARGRLKNFREQVARLMKQVSELSGKSETSPSTSPEKSKP